MTRALPADPWRDYTAWLRSLLNPYKPRHKKETDQ